MELTQQEECVVSGALAVLLRLSRWVGMAPLQIHRLRGGDYSIKFNRTIHVIGSIIMVFFSAISLNGTFTLKLIPLTEIPLGKNTAWTLINISNLLVINVIIFIVVCGGDRRMKKLISIVNYIQVNTQNIDLVKPKAWKLWTAILSFFVAYGFLMTYQFYTNLFILFLFLSEIYLVLNAAVHHAFFNATLYIYVKTLNREIQKLFTNNTDELHNWGCPVRCCWVLVHIATLVAMVEPCHRLQQEMSLTKARFSQVICRDDLSKDMRKDLDNFFMQLLLGHPSCVPMGLCTFNRSFLATIAAAGTTLLIIILQFKLTP